MAEEANAAKLEAKAGPSMPKVLRFVFGGAAGMGATLFVQPLDLAKNRMQVARSTGGDRPSTLSVVRGVVRNEGILTLYNGLSAGLLRQATYTTARLGIYTWLLEKFADADGTAPNFLKKVAMGILAGGGGAFVGTPAEVALIRMTSDGSLPVEKRRNYSSVVNALVRIQREEGLLAPWRGAVPTMARSCVVNAAQLATYSQAKQGLLHAGLRDGLGCHFLASMTSGLVTTVVSMPVDIVKTRLQSMKVVDGAPEYRGAGDAFVKIVRSEGVVSLWKGFTPYYLRVGPHTVLTFIFFEQLSKAYKTYVMGVRGGEGGL